MENTMQIFKNADFGEIRTISIAGEPWFVAKDVCDILGIQNTSDTISKVLDDDEAKILASIYVRSNNGVTQARKVITISESGLYHLIFVSRKPEARFFRRWVTHEVLPQIRKTGSYGDNSRGIRTVVDKMLDIQKQQMDIIRSLVDPGSSMDCNVYNETQGVDNIAQDVRNHTRYSGEEILTEYAGDVIRKIRTGKEITQAELARRAHLERSHLVHIEKERTSPTVPVFFRLVKALNMVVILADIQNLEERQNE